MADEEKAAEEKPKEGEETEEPKKKGLGLIPMIIAAIVVAGVAAGAAFMFAPTPGGDSEEQHADAGDEHGDDKTGDHGAKDEHGEKKKDKKKKKKKGGGHGGKDGEGDVKAIGKIQHSEYATFLVLDPIIVSIQPIGRSKHLKISLVLETGEEDAETLLEHGFYVKDVLNTYLRSIDGSVLEDPAAMSRLRAQIQRRISAVVPNAQIKSVLITDFVLT
ncbi:flagellar basal body-associated FliL family protein [Hyphococcus flavus]|uniref:Flagellar protein FliL n=1 Tax=Hyphococcus flavus TaxID=1866326 RepID=A0AAE9ZIF1_9PROT|nr:flagellar basal body-associated FliL family protein [Hyphococcus flavus]WDI31536.1 flagellar basal body-associated FliL family protein [Hyphococcus flavus]